MSGAPSGIGRGEAQVYNMDRSMQAFDNVLQSQALQRQREQKAMQDQIKSLDTKNLREPDQDEYYKLYDKWRESRARVDEERDSRKKFQAQTEAEKQFRELESFAKRSAEAKANDADFASRLLDDRFRVQFKDDAVNQFQSNFKKPITDPTYIGDKSTLARQIDENKIFKELDTVDATLLKTAKWNRMESKHTLPDGTSGVQLADVREIPYEQRVLAYSNQYMIDRDFQKLIADKFPGIDPKEAIAEVARSREETRPLIEYGKTEFSKTDNWKEKALFNDGLAQRREARAEARKAKSAEDIDATQRQTLVDGVVKGDARIENQLQGLVESNEKFMTKKNKEGKQVPGQLKIVKRKGSSLVTYVIPAKWKLNASGGQLESPPREVTIDMKQPNAQDKVNQMISDITDVNITNESYRGQKGNKNKGTADVVKRYAGLDENGNPIFK